MTHVLTLAWRSRSNERDLGPPITRNVKLRHYDLSFAGNILTPRPARLASRKVEPEGAGERSGWRHHE